MTEQRLIYLFNGYLNNRFTEAEFAEFSGILCDPAYEDLIKQIMDLQMGNDTEEHPIHSQQADQILDKIFRQKRRPVLIRLLRHKLLRYAAAVMLLAIAGYLWLLHLQQPSKPQQERVSTQHTSITPGSNKALLTLEDGSTVDLAKPENDLLLQQRGITINQHNGLLEYSGQYNNGNISSTGKIEKPAFNILSTPRGGQYQLTLPDGSRVWLNAASSIRFPLAFSGNERRVFITGEAYFEVRKDPSRPFRVSGSGQEIQVLGTSFNVNLYADEPEIRTTLIEGRVCVKTASDSLVLAPEQQAIIAMERLQMSAGKAQQQIQVRKVNTDAVIAWRFNRFKLEEGNIPYIMRQVARWYDVDVELKGDLSEIVLSGSISRKEQVSQLLELLEGTGLVHFSVNGRKIIVTPANNKPN